MHKQYRLTRKEDYNKVYRFGKSAANQQFVVYYMRQASTEHCRLGISVSKKIGNAVVRNRLRRLIKEIVRHHIASIVHHYDFILIARKPAVSMEYLQMEKSILHVLKKAALIEKANINKADVVSLFPKL